MVAQFDAVAQVASQALCGICEYKEASLQN